MSSPSPNNESPPKKIPSIVDTLATYIVIGAMAAFSAFAFALVAVLNLSTHLDDSISGESYTPKAKAAALSLFRTFTILAAGCSVLWLWMCVAGLQALSREWDALMKAQGRVWTRNPAQQKMLDDAAGWVLGATSSSTATSGRVGEKSQQQDEVKGRKLVRVRGGEVYLRFPITLEACDAAEEGCVVVAKED